MALRHAPMNAYVRFPSYYGNKTEPVIHPYFKPNTEDTYIAISGLNQEGGQKQLIDVMTRHGAKFLYISPKAVNTKYRGEEARNVLMIFEFDEVKP